MGQRYPVQFEPADEGGYVITFPDVPPAITQAETLEEAYENAAEALGEALAAYADRNEPIPPPSKADPKRHHLIAVPAWTEAILAKRLTPTR
jgi:antitoxin HicB